MELDKGLKAKVGFILAAVYMEGVLSGQSEEASVTWKGAITNADKIHDLYQAAVDAQTRPYVEAHTCENDKEHCRVVNGRCDQHFW